MSQSADLREGQHSKSDGEEYDDLGLLPPGRGEGRSAQSDDGIEKVTDADNGAQGERENEAGYDISKREVVQKTLSLWRKHRPNGKAVHCEVQPVGME